MYLFHSSVLLCCFSSLLSYFKTMTVQLLQVHEKIYLTKVLHLAQQMPVIIDLVDQMTFGQRFHQRLQISHCCKRFCLVLSFKGYISPSFLPPKPETIFVPRSTAESTLISSLGITPMAILMSWFTGKLNGLCMTKKLMNLRRWWMFFLLLAWTSRCCSDHVPVVTPVKSRSAHNTMGR